MTVSTNQNANIKAKENGNANTKTIKNTIKNKTTKTKVSMKATTKNYSPNLIPSEHKKGKDRDEGKWKRQGKIQSQR